MATPKSSVAASTALSPQPKRQAWDQEESEHGVDQKRSE